MEASNPDAGLTTEHIKSHLQKYRLNYERSRRELASKHKRRRCRSDGRSKRDRFPVKMPQDLEYSATDSETRTNALALRPIGDNAAAVSVDYSVPVAAATSAQRLMEAQWSAFGPMMPGPRPELDSRWRGDELSIRIPGQSSSLREPRQDELPAQKPMTQAMQQQMNWHRQMLTRKVALVHTAQAGSSSTDSGFSSQDWLGGDFEPAWTRRQENISEQMTFQSLQQRTASAYGSPLQMKLPGRVDRFKAPIRRH